MPLNGNGKLTKLLTFSKGELHILHNKWLRWLVGIVAVYLTGRFFLLPLLPFLLALLFAVLLEPAILWCCRRLDFQRKFAAAALTTLLLFGGFLLVFFLCGKLWEQGRGMIEGLPELLGRLPEATALLEQRYRGFYRACPEEIRLWLDNTAQVLAAESLSLAGELSGALLGKVSVWMGKLPHLLLFLFTTLLSVYFTTAAYPELLRFLRRQIPTAWQGRLRGVASCLRSTFWKWLKAEGILCVVTFLMLLLGFWYLRMEYALLLAVVIGVVDALPVLGAGLFLVPWALGHLLLGSVPRGVALLALYGMILLVRSILEPKLMAAQVGLPPLAALLAMYLGFSFFGVGGMLLLPVLLLFLKQLQDGGYLSVWQ